MNRSACANCRVPTGGGEVISDRDLCLTPLIGSVPEKQNKRTSKFKPFPVGANQRSCSTISLRKPSNQRRSPLCCWWWHKNIIVAAEGCGGDSGVGDRQAGREDWVWASCGVDRSQHFDFFCFVFDFEATARCEEKWRCRWIWTNSDIKSWSTSLFWRLAAPPIRRSSSYKRPTGSSRWVWSLWDSCGLHSMPPSGWEIMFPPGCNGTVDTFKLIPCVDYWEYFESCLATMRSWG